MKALKRFLLSAFILNYTTISVFANQSSESTARGIFSNEYIFTILLVVAIAGAVLEILTPGFGFGGTISLVCFGLFFWGNLLMGHTDWYSVILFVIGILLIGLEVLIPGFGIAGIGGIFALIAAIVLAMSDIYFAFLSLLIAIVISAIIGTYLLKKGLNSEVINRMRLFTSTNTDSGFLSNDNAEVEVGQKMVTLTILRPTGYALFDGKKMEVISSSGFVDREKEVVVVKISGSRIYVELAK